MGEVKFVCQAGAEGVRFNESQIVLMQGIRPGDVAKIRQNAAPGPNSVAKFVHLGFPEDVRDEAEAVRVTKVVIHAAIVSIPCGG